MFLTGRIAIDKKQEDFKGPVTDVDVVYYTEEVSDFVVDRLKLDAVVFDDANLHTLGRVIDFDIGESVIYGPKSDGGLAVVTKDNYKSAYITGRANVTRTRLGFTFKKANYGVGHSMTLRAGDAKIFLRIYDIYSTQRRDRRPLETTSNYKCLEMCK